MSDSVDTMPCGLCKKIIDFKSDKKTVVKHQNTYFYVHNDCYEKLSDEDKKEVSLLAGDE